MTAATEPSTLLDAWLTARPASAPPAITLAEVEELARLTGLPRRAVEIALLERERLPARYERNLGALGIAGQLALLRAEIAVVGAGGLGGWVAEGLCRLGVGRLRLVDHDRYQDSNLNRQLGCTEATLGQSKASTLAARLAQVNGAVTVQALDTRLTAENAATLLADVAIVVDALDSIQTRLLVQRTVRALGIPLVHGAIAGWTGQVMTILPGDVGLEALYGAAPAFDRGVEAQTGTPSATPMLVAAWMVQECAKLLTGRGALIRQRLLLFDALFGEVSAIELT